MWLKMSMKNKSFVLMVVRKLILLSKKRQEKNNRKEKRNLWLVETEHHVSFPSFHLHIAV